MTVELACSQQSRYGHSLRFPVVNSMLNICTNRTYSSLYPLVREPRLSGVDSESVNRWVRLGTQRLNASGA